MKKRDCHQHSRQREWPPPSILGSSLSCGLMKKKSVGLNRWIKFDPSTAGSEGPRPPTGAGQGEPLTVLELLEIEPVNLALIVRDRKGTSENSHSIVYIKGLPCPTERLLDLFLTQLEKVFFPVLLRNNQCTHCIHLRCAVRWFDLRTLWTDYRSRFSQHSSPHGDTTKIKERNISPCEENW